MNKLYIAKIKEIAERENLKLPFEIREDIDTQIFKIYNYIDTTHSYIEEHLEASNICFFDFLACFDNGKYPLWDIVAYNEEYELMKMYYHNQILIEQIIPLLDKIRSNTI